MAAEGEGGHGVNGRVKGVVVSGQEGADQTRKHVAGPNVGLKGRGTVRQAGQAGAVSDDVDFAGRPQYVDGITSDSESEGGVGGFDGAEELDPLFDQAVQFVTEKRKASISGVQRQFRIGYNRAARI